MFLCFVCLNRPSSLKDEGQTNQAIEDLKINTTDHEHFVENTTARQVYRELFVCKENSFKKCKEVPPGFLQRHFVLGKAKKA